MRATKKMRLTHLHFTTGLLALALACVSALCIYFYTTPAHATSANNLTNSKVSSARIVFDDTETETPSRTPTRTATATSTSTSTPAPSPSATHPTRPSPTSTRPADATARPSSTTTSQQTPTSGNVATGAHQTPVASPVSTNKQNSQANQGAIPTPTGDTFPVVP